MRESGHAVKIRSTRRVNSGAQLISCLEFTIDSNYDAMKESEP